eukprot:5545608-Prymnesium_polylepis.1
MLANVRREDIVERPKEPPADGRHGVADPKGDGGAQPAEPLRQPAPAAGSLRRRARVPAALELPEEVRPPAEPDEPLALDARAEQREQRIAAGAAGAHDDDALVRRRGPCEQSGVHLARMARVSLVRARERRHGRLRGERRVHYGVKRPDLLRRLLGLTVRAAVAARFARLGRPPLPGRLVRLARCGGAPPRHRECG